MMNNKSKKLAWNILIDRADNDTSEWQLFSSNILMVFVDQGLIVTPSLSKADEIVQGFNTKEFEEWKDGVQKGVKGGNQADLLHHHMYLLPWTPDHIQLLQCATSLFLMIFVFQFYVERILYFSTFSTIWFTGKDRNWG